jgi:hypothetical protein
MNMTYIIGGAVAGYFLGPSMMRVEPIMGAAAGAVAGYVVDQMMQ